jgi:multidrug efflux pump subunit AcrA (membrane-fusion protein)
MTQWLRSAAEATGRKRTTWIPTESMLVQSTLILGAALLTGCGKAPAAAGPPPALPVSVVQVEASDVPVSNEWVGTLDGFVNAQIQPQANGYLIKQTYTEGAQVAKGQILFEIDPRPFQAALDQAKGQLAQAQGQVLQAQAQLGLAEINVKRDTPLAQARAIAQSQLDNDVQTKAQTEASVASAKASVAAA